MYQERKFKDYFKKWYFWALTIFIFIFQIYGEGRIPFALYLGFFLGSFIISLFTFWVIFIIRKTLGNKIK